MYASGEIRWFLPGEPPAPLSDWIARSDLGCEEAERVDEYLFLPGCEATGVKLREGRFEIKARTAEPVPVSFGESISGLRDAWVKWSRFAPDEAALHALVVDPADDWIFVAKRRLLRKFSIDGAGLREVDAAAVLPPPRGCQFEMSVVRAVPGKLDDRAAACRGLQSASPWWSLSLENFGAGAPRLDDVGTAAEFLFARVDPGRLERSDSLSYPAWLNSQHAPVAP